MNLLDRGISPSYKTPFEKNILPAFSNWFLKKLTLDDIDLIVPIERKGAHLLRKTLDYLRINNGFTFSKPIYYKRAFFFIEQIDIKFKKIILLDDSTHSGKSLFQHRSILRKCGGENISMTACLGIEPNHNENYRFRKDIECFRTVASDLYQEYLWEISEMIEHEGLLPEVDHHEFLLKPEGSFSRFWDQLLKILNGYGDLDYHGLISRKQPIYSATLHWPRFFNLDTLPKHGKIRRDGIIKLRLFANLHSEEISLIPMVYPEIELPIESKRGDPGRDKCIQFYKEWNHHNEDIGLKLIENSVEHNFRPEVLYHAVSLQSEVEMLKSLTKILREETDNNCNFRIKSYSTHFVNLYGIGFGKSLAKSIDVILEKESQSLNKNLHFRSDIKSYISPIDDETNFKIQSQNHSYESNIDQELKKIIIQLKKSYYQKNKDINRGNWDSMGFSFEELIKYKNGSKSKNRRTIISRCIDLGCGNTSLVPFIDTDFNNDEKKILIIRKYRTSEQVMLIDKNDKIKDESDSNSTDISHDHVGYEDLSNYNTEVTQETVATIINLLNRKSKKWNENSVPAFILYKIIAILYTVCDDIKYTNLAIMARDYGPEATITEHKFIHEYSHLSLRNIKSEHFKITSEGGFAVTSSFKKNYSNKTLRLCTRKSIGSIESYSRILLNTVFKLIRLFHQIQVIFIGNSCYEL